MHRVRGHPTDYFGFTAIWYNNSSDSGVHSILCIIMFSYKVPIYATCRIFYHQDQHLQFCINFLQTSATYSYHLLEWQKYFTLILCTHCSTYNRSSVDHKSSLFCDSWRFKSSDMLHYGVGQVLEVPKDHNVPIFSYAVQTE